MLDKLTVAGYWICNNVGAIEDINARGKTLSCSDQSWISSSTFPSHHLCVIIHLRFICSESFH